MTELPSHARVVVIGGGVVGASALYHLARLGWRDLLLLERNELTSGSTWHAAGNCPNFAGGWSLLKLQHYSTRLYAGLAEAVGVPIAYHRTGSLRLAQSKARMQEFRHVAAMARHQGLDFELLAPQEVHACHPLVELHGLEGALWDPGDGDIDPSQLTQAFAKGARDLGARIERFCPVTAIAERPGGGWRVETPKGAVDAEVVVNAAGYRAPEIARMVGRELPSVVMAHQYLVTEDVPDLSARAGRLPLLRDPDDSYYLRQEGQALLLGPYEWQATPMWLDGLPDDFAFQLYPDDLDRLERHIALACARVPALARVGLRRTINGPIPYTPDGNPLIGPAPGLRNFFECCVFSFGIVQAGGAGKALAEWIVEGEPEWDLWSVDPRRYTDFATPAYTVAKAVELYQNEYAIGFPREERPAGRPSKVSPLYETLKARGAVFGARGGWERAQWFATPGTETGSELTFAREGNWFAAVAAECRAVAERVGILDLPGFARFEVSGPGAAAWLDRLVAGALPRPGRIALAYFCSPRGGIVSEMTITRLSEDRFWLLGPAAGEWHDRDWLAGHLPDQGVTLENLTADWGTLVVAGPRAREVLAPLTDCDLSNAAFPWLSARQFTLGGAPGGAGRWALRVNYLGELGWELHLPVAALAAAYEAIRAAGDAHGIADIGGYAVDSLRLEKGYRAWKQDLETGYSPLAASLDRFVRLDKPDFIGRDALLRERAAGPRERLVPLLVEAGAEDAPFCATVWQGARRVGLVTSGGYGHRLGRYIALAYVAAPLAVEGTALEVEIYGERRAARVAREPLYDPDNERPRA